MFPGGVPGHATALGATVRGVPPNYGGVAPGRPGFGYGNYRGGRQPQRTIILPYAVPVFGGGFGYGYDPFYASTPVTMPVEPVAQQPPVVIINQAYQPDTINPQVREYTNLPAPSQQQQQQESSLKVYQNLPKQDDKPTIFLIAMKDGNIMPALSYWVEDDTLNYITRDSDHNRVSLDRVDRSFSMRLNEERGLEFRIPERRPIQ
ncbi:hypothetical protein F183_A38810 [Bryobacterales bacterium F-183]|nr:hypothetical protein F183_A38810 [Bryobacterales bacterium F-183]